MAEHAPKERAETVREAIRRALLSGTASARELSVGVGLCDKEVAEHLAHLARSLPHRGERLVIEPATCIACGFAFAERPRLTRSGACPRCRSTRIDPPAFRIEPPSTP